MSDLIGTLLNDRYRLDAELGRGGMGVVYRAHDTLLGRDVAVKVLSASTWGAEGRARLMHEARAVARLNHPNIVAVHDAGEANGSPFIVMELVEGESLAVGQVANLSYVVAIAVQVCAALEHAHDQGIVHRDLKPGNVMLTPEGTAKLMDFGLARSAASRLTAEGAIVGTWSYIAPEQARGREVDARADLYALGVMLYELTTGRLPFVADDPVMVIYQHVHAPVVPPRARNDQIPPALDDLIVRLLSKDPADRPASAAEVRQTLEQPGFLEPDRVPAPELSVLARIERGRLVGREPELRTARELWQQATAGQGQVLLISGEPGVGKTRLVRELATQAEALGGQVLVGASYAQGGRPYDACRQVVRPVLRDGPEDGFNLPEPVLADLLTLVPELRSRYPDVPANPPLDPQDEQQRLLEHLLLFVTALSERAPLLLVLEDAHWADSGTLALLRHLARHTRHQQVLLVATYREVELDAARPFHEVLLDLQRERLATRLKLARLGREETKEMLAVLFDEAITPEFLDGIYRETEGNPFFVEEVCKALVESGQLTYQDGRWHRPSMTELGIPQSVRVAIQARVGVLPAAAQEVLRLAAVLGREFEFDILAQASDQDEDVLIEALEDAERAQLIAAVGGAGGETFAFVHGLIPATLMEGLRVLERRRLHLRVARAIEAQRPDDMAALAYHYGQTREAEKAVHYLQQVGDQARSLYAHQEAVASYQQALELLQEAGDLEHAARTLMKLGLTYHNAFDFPAARQAYEEGFALWQRVGETEPAVPPPPAPHALRIVTTVQPLTLDPGLFSDSFSQVVIEQLFSGLVELGPELDVLPDVARSWEMLDGGRRYVFTLRDDVRWSDGSPVTAGDFEYAWKRVLDPATGAPAAAFWHDVQGSRAYHRGEVVDPDQVGVRARDDVTLVVELEGPTGYFLSVLADPVTFPVPRHVVQAHGVAWTEPANIVTNGPFRLASWERGESLVLERNPTYHGRFAGNLQRVEQLFLRREEFTRLLQMYENGDLHVLRCPPTVGGERARQRYAGEYVSGPGLSTFYIGFDGHRPPFDDARVRQAFTQATDRETLAGVALRGHRFPATGGLVPPGMPGHSPGIGLPYDPERARQLLAAAGYPGGRGFPELEALTWTSLSGLLAIEYLQAQWLENLGVEIVWQTVAFGELLDRLSRKVPPMWWMGWNADYPDPDNFLRVGFPWGPTGWQNEAYERLVEEARRITHQGQRMRMYQQADRILVEEAPILPLLHGRLQILVKPWMRKFPVSPMRRNFWKDVVIEPH